jgi:2-phosphoglycerate kinase
MSVKQISVTAGEFLLRRCYQDRNQGRMMTTNVVLIAGPTASGKSALALEVAEQLGGVIINADSMQVYRDLHIITHVPLRMTKSEFRTNSTDMSTRQKIIPLGAGAGMSKKPSPMSSRKGASPCSSGVPDCISRR